MPRQLMLYNIPKDANGNLWKPAELALFVDRFIMTPELKREQYARDMLAVNNDIEFHLYVLQHGGHLALPGMPNNNQALTRKGEAEEFLKQYPGGALHTPDGKVILKNEKQDYFVANTSHAEWRSRFVRHVTEVKKRAPFFKYLFLDDLGTEKRFNYVGYRDVKEFATREAYFEHTCDWITYTTQHVALANGLRPGGNLQAPPEQIDDWKRAAGIILLAGGAVTIEFGWLNHKGERQLSNWLNTLQKASHVTRNGGQVNVIIQRDPRQLADKSSRAYHEFEFCLYSQKLISNEIDGMRVADQYDYFVDIPAIRGIDAELGKPKGEYRKEGDWYLRDFENFGVAVNPQTFEHKRVEPPIIVVESPKPPETVTLNISFQLTVPAAIAPVIQQAVDSMVIMAASAQTTPTIE